MLRSDSFGLHSEKTGDAKIEKEKEEKKREKERQKESEDSCCVAE
jgi:hypothetical protein